jgi:hypothetical protein
MAVACNTCDKLFAAWNEAVDRAHQRFKAGRENPSQTHNKEIEQAIRAANLAKVALDTHRKSCGQG